jgi:hypothetical protein
MLFTIETGLDPVLRELVSHLIATQQCGRRLRVYCKPKNQSKKVQK